MVDAQMLEHFIREDLKLKAPRVMGVLNPLKVIITNYPEDQTEMLELENNQDVEEMGKRQVPFSREIDRKSTRLNSSHANISYAVFCLKKKKNPDYFVQTSSSVS